MRIENRNRTAQNLVLQLTKPDKMSQTMMCNETIKTLVVQTPAPSDQYVPR